MLYHDGSDWIWKTKDGVETPVKLMTDKHISNTIKKLKDMLASALYESAVLKESSDYCVFHDAGRYSVMLDVLCKERSRRRHIMV